MSKLWNCQICPQSHYLAVWIQPFCPHPGGIANSKMKQISSPFSLSLCFSADSISLLKAIQQCPTHWSGRGSVQCGGKWPSPGMIDLNSTMAPPKATQAPLRVMDARMAPIPFSSMGKTLFHYQCRPHLFPSPGRGGHAESGRNKWTLQKAAIKNVQALWCGKSWKCSNKDLGLVLGSFIILSWE